MAGERMLGRVTSHMTEDRSINRTDGELGSTLQKPIKSGSRN
jgi:hypothetical protein